MRHFKLMLLLALTACAPKAVTVTVSNPLSIDRKGEVVEVSAALVEQFKGAFTVTGTEGEVPWQLTSDGKLLFPATVGANGSASYKIAKGQPAPQDTLCLGNIRPDRLDDFIWENDMSGYRTYGPALQKRGERAFGYDVFTKSVTYPVMNYRFDKKSEMSFHLDHGNGMDSYGVGPTLGCGADALVGQDGNIVYPWCYVTQEVLDEGPLRFCARFTYSPVTVDGKTVKETRVITLDKGSYMNKVSVSFDGLSGKTPIVAGVVVHPENPEAYACGKDDTGAWLGYADLGDRNIGQNGNIFVGCVFASPVDDVAYVPFTPEDLPQRAGAIGHVLACSSYAPGSQFSYWFGSSWSKAGAVSTLEDWSAILKSYQEKFVKPLEIVIEK